VRRALLAGALVLLVLPVATSAQLPVQTLAYVKGAYTDKLVLWAANVDGTHRHKLAAGGQWPVVSPDGRQVAYVQGFAHATLRVIPATGGTPKTVAKNVWETDQIHWSADSTKLSVVTGKELGPYTLKLVDLTTGTTRSLATGTFLGVSFAPDSSGVVWSRVAKDTSPEKADLYTTDLAGGPVKRITTDHNALEPVWGPQDIVFSRQRKPPKKGDYYKLDLYTIAADGTGRKRLTTTKVPYLLAGLSAIGFSADGSHLLAEYGGQDTSEAWRVDTATGAAKDVTGKFDGVTGAAISSDGTAILARAGYFDDPKGDIASINYATGKKTVLVTDASSPSWNK